MSFHSDIHERGGPVVYAVIADFAPVAYGVKKFDEITKSSGMVMCPQTYPSVG
jgi:hypothetical protein